MKHSYKRAIINVNKIACGLMTIRVLLVVVLMYSFTMLPMEESREYDIKAAFLYKFTYYIDWDSLIPGNDFIIGVVGNSPILGPLNEIAKSRTVNNKKIVIRKFSRAEEIQPCNILFISGQTSLQLNDILEHAHDKGILTVSEQQGYAAKGTEINFVEIDNKLKFEANPKLINAAGLKASSQLLKLAIIIQ